MIFLALSFSLFTLISLVICPVNKPYDYYLFHLIWTTTYCYHNECNGRERNLFVIYGIYLFLI